MGIKARLKRWTANPRRTRLAIAAMLGTLASVTGAGWIEADWVTLIIMAVIWAAWEIMQKKAKDAEEKESEEKLEE